MTFTNLYANNTNRQRWHDITAAELKLFFSVIIYMGINKMSRREFYFNNEYFKQSFVYSKFTIKRFTDILICLHYVEAGIYNPATIETMNLANPFWLVTPFLTELKNRCLMHFIPYQKICIDEQCIPFKGRHKARQYNKDKPDKRHFKVFCLNDSYTGYLIDFHLYPGAAEVRPNNVTATNYPAYLLTNNPLFMNKNHILITDNWFTSEWSILEMRNRMIHQLGTMKWNKLGDAKPLSIKDKDKSARGTIKYYHNIANNYYFISYQDNRPVNFFSALPSFSHLTHKINGNGGLFQAATPSITTLYIKNMRGTDRFDQLNSYYWPFIRSVKWPSRIFIHFLYVAIINSHIIYKQYFNLTRQDHEFELVYYLQRLMIQLAEPVGDDIESESSEEDEHTAKYSRVVTTEFRRSGKHVCMKVDSTPNPNNPTKPNYKRRVCQICYARTSCYCNKCKVALHIKNSFGNPCWEIWHHGEDD